MQIDFIILYIELRLERVAAGIYIYIYIYIVTTLQSGKCPTDLRGGYIYPHWSRNHG